MTCEATWIVASFQSTIVPFIHTLPVPSKAMGAPYRDCDTCSMILTPTVGGVRGDPSSTTYCVSLQNGQRRAFAGSGLRQFQQKRLTANSRVRIRLRTGRG